MPLSVTGLFDFSTVEALLRSIKELQIPDCSLKPLPRKPNRLGTSAFAAVVSRADAVAALLSKLSSRLKRDHVPETKSNPLLATQAAPGGGKTFFLDYMCQISTGEIAAESLGLEQSLGLTFLQSAMCIPITFNGASS